MGWFWDPAGASRGGTEGQVRRSGWTFSEGGVGGSSSVGQAGSAGAVPFKARVPAPRIPPDTIAEENLQGSVRNWGETHNLPTQYTPQEIPLNTLAHLHHVID